ncbi:unnamed protein product, partial [Lepeophtheirus salmonis]
MTFLSHNSDSDDYTVPISGASTKGPLDKGEENGDTQLSNLKERDPFSKPPSIEQKKNKAKEQDKEYTFEKEPHLADQSFPLSEGFDLRIHSNPIKEEIIDRNEEISANLKMESLME